MRSAPATLFAVFVCLLLAPAGASAQSAIAGVVKDTSGAVLPGVSVEASSDVLIERFRTVTTDGAGQYRIVDLRPGVYVVTFTLQGFQTLRRERVDLPSDFTASINADLRVGALEESVTVTAESPIVDVTTAVHTQVLNRDTIDSIPTGRTIQGMGQLIVGISLNLPDTGGARAMQQTYMSTHGMTTANTTVLVDGMMVNGLQSDGAVQSYFNDAMNQEVSYQTSGIGADTQAGGVRLNMIPREGGNRFSGDFKSAYRPGTWQGNNLTQRHLDKGLQTGNATDRIVDFTVSQGGPILKDKLWFFATARYISVNNFIPDTFLDDGSKGVDDQFIKSGLARLTWQVSPRNKLSLVLRRGRQVPRPRHAGAVRPGNGGDRLVLAGLPHHVRQVDVDGHEPAAHRRRLVEQHRELHEQLSARPRRTAGHRRLVCRRHAVGARSGRPHGRRALADDAESDPVCRERVGLVRDRVAPPEGRPAANVGHLLPHGGRPRRSHAAVPQQQHRQTVHGARHGHHPEHAASPSTESG